MKFETFDEKMATSDKYISRSGDGFLQEYEYKIDDAGVKKLVKADSKINVYDRIQADYDSTDINKLMLRFSLGDTEAINIRSGEFLDVTELPKTLAEVFDRALQAEQYFKDLPTDLKEMFNNSPTEFFAAYGTKEFDAKIDKFNDRFIDHSFDLSVEESQDPKEYVEVER